MYFFFFAAVLWNYALYKLIPVTSKALVYFYAKEKLYTVIHSGRQSSWLPQNLGAGNKTLTRQNDSNYTNLSGKPLYSAIMLECWGVYGRQLLSFFLLPPCDELWWMLAGPAVCRASDTVAVEAVGGTWDIWALKWPRGEGGRYKL